MEKSQILSLFFTELYRYIHGHFPDFSRIVDVSHVLNVTKTIFILKLQGNDKADQLAKKGAKDALEMPEDSRIVTIQEVKDASNKTGLAKWQTRWENSSTGRRFHEFYPTVACKRRFDFPDKLTSNAILQLQTGYSRLNAYRNTTGQKVPSECRCGTLETPEHYLLECKLYADQREALTRSLQKVSEIPALDAHTLLSTEENPDLNDWRDI